MTQPTPKPSDWLSLLILGLVWGSAFLFTALSLEGYTPLTVAALRTTIGAASLWSLLLITTGRLGGATRAHIPSIFWTGILSSAVPFLLLAWGLLRVPSAFAGLSMTSVPLMVLILAHFFSDERMTTRKAVGVLFGFVGALVLIGPGLLQLGQGAELLAQLACLGAAMCYSVSSIVTRRCPPIQPLLLSAWALTVGMIVLVPLAWIHDGLPGWEGARPVGALLFLGLLPTAAMMLLRVRVIQSAGSVFMTLVNYMVPLWAMIFGTLILSEALPFRFFVALVLILSGLAISQWGSLQRLLAGLRARP